MKWGGTNKQINLDITDINTNTNTNTDKKHLRVPPPLAVISLTLGLLDPCRLPCARRTWSFLFCQSIIFSWLYNFPFCPWQYCHWQGYHYSLIIAIRWSDGQMVRWSDVQMFRWSHGQTFTRALISSSSSSVIVSLRTEPLRARLTPCCLWPTSSSWVIVVQSWAIFLWWNIVQGGDPL